MSKNKGSNLENLEKTHQLFLELAYREFVDNGYANGSTSRIVEKSGMARGSLYYHFKDKRALFLAVYAQLLFNVNTRIAAKMEQVNDPWDALKLGLSEYIRECMNRETRRIIIEAYSASSYEERIRIQADTILKTFRIYIKKSMENGYFKGQDHRIVGILMYGMISEAGRSYEFLTKNHNLDEKLIPVTLEMLDKMAR